MAILTVYKTRTTDDPEAKAKLSELKAKGYAATDVLIEHVMRVQGELIPEFALPKIEQLFCNPIIERISTASLLDEDIGPVIEISYKPAWTDPEMPSAQHAFEALGLSGVSWVRLAKRYQLVGLDEQTARQAAHKILGFNPEVKTFVERNKPWTTLIPSGATGAVEWLEVRSMSLDDLRQMSQIRRLHMADNQLLELKRIFRHKLDRAARDGEVEFIAARWSDHCSHTTYKALGLLAEIQNATARINHPLVVSAFVDNAGGMLFYDGWVIIFKGETHISPTFTGDPYGGIMTKHGGVIRDIIFMALGGWPIAGTTVTGIADPRIPWDQVPSGAFHPTTVLNESIRGTHDYTNPMGIPMAWSEYLTHPRNWKGLALGHSIGIIPEAKAQKGTARPGDFVVLIGGLTGADGIHGATVSSASATAETVTVDAAHVQIGAPIEERTFMEAVPVLRDADCIDACTDCGAAGLGSAVGEMGDDCGGVWMNTAWVPLKCAGLVPWQIILSESQERGVLAVPSEKLALTLSILAEYSVRAKVIGVFTDTGSFQAVHDESINQEKWTAVPEAKMSGMVVCDLPYKAVKESPLPDIKVRERKRDLKPFVPQMPKTESAWVELVRKHLAHFNIADQSRIAHLYDQTVQGNTVMPYISGVRENMQDDLFVCAPLRGKPYGCGIANAVNQFYGEVDPAGMGRLVYVDAVTRLVAAGFAPNDITTCVNVYTPKVTDSPENAWDLVQLVKHGYVPASEELGIPVITGKDSSSGTFWTADGERIDAPITLDVLAVGRCPHVGRLVKKPFRKPGDKIILFHPGIISGGLGGSVFLDGFGQRGDRLCSHDLKNLLEGWNLYHEWLSDDSRSIYSRSAISTGGLIRRLFECCIGSGLGCSIELYSDNPLLYPADPLRQLFGEYCGSVLFTTDRMRYDDCFYTEIGEVTEQPNISVVSGNQLLFTASTDELSADWQKTVSEVLS